MLDWLKPRPEPVDTKLVEVLKLILTQQVLSVKLLRQQTEDISSIRGLIWRMAVIPPDLVIQAKGETMGYINFEMNLMQSPVDDVVLQRVTVTADGKKTAVSEFDTELGQLFKLSLLQGEKAIVSLAFVDDVGNESTKSLAIEAIDTFAPAAPDDLSITAVSETDAPVGIVLEAVPVPEPAPEPEPTPEPTPEPEVVDDSDQPTPPDTVPGGDGPEDTSTDRAEI